MDIVRVRVILMLILKRVECLESGFIRCLNAEYTFCLTWIYSVYSF